MKKKNKKRQNSREKINKYILEVEKLWKIYNPNSSPDNILLTETTNCAAKVIDGNFYLLKPVIIVSSMESDAMLFFLG